MIVDIGIAFTDMGRNLQVTRFTTENVAAHAQRRPPAARASWARRSIYVLCTLAIFNVSYGLMLALLTTALPERAGAFFRAVWLLPRMSPSVVYALLWSWVVAPTDYGLLNQVLAGAGPAAARPQERRADAAHHARQRLHRRVVRHDHLHQRDPRDPASICSTPPGSTAPAGLRSSVTSRCRRSAGRSAS